MGVREKGFAVLPAVAEFPGPGAGGVDLVQHGLDQGAVLFRRVGVENITVSAQQFPRLIIEHGVKGRVGVDDVAVLVGDGDPFGHARQHQSLGAQGLFGLFAQGDVFGQGDEAPHPPSLVIEGGGGEADVDEAAVLALLCDLGAGEGLTLAQLLYDGQRLLGRFLGDGREQEAFDLFLGPAEDALGGRVQGDQPAFGVKNPDGQGCGLK